MTPGWSRQVVKATAAAVDELRRPPAGLVVLIYHRVGRHAPIEVDLPLGLFEEQISFLAASNRLVTLSDGLSRVLQPTATPTPLVAITFDDGTADFADVALPVLERYRAPVALYIATEFVDAGRVFPDDGTPLSWRALADAHSTGLVDVGSHTHRHALLDRLDPSLVDDELDRSIDLIAAHVGVAPQHFAYPKAVLGSRAAEEAVRRRFRSAALAGTRPNRYGATDPHRLARSPVQVSDAMRWFRRKTAGGLGFEDVVRRGLNRRRYSGTTT